MMIVRGRYEEVKGGVLGMLMPFRPQLDLSRAYSIFNPITMNEYEPKTRD